ncbi:dehyrdogenase reductase domain-containing [Trichoderma arundinaceum]|uniref:Dehyrdogenase reductase domain-containing n=1 Tax=Trichoderma arundinaceum TaxID=490622 RepID=A0A395P1B8_TRIAR|nr:dehyrdogenase reductase domain-containing [Trichoderma arundinaceum]
MAPLTGRYVSKLVGTNVLILGGTSGIGFAVAQAVVEYGANVVVSSSQQRNIDTTLARLREEYPNSSTDQIRGYTCDLSDAENLEKNIDSLLQKAANGGKINHIVYTATDPVKVTPTSEFTVESLNKSGLFRLTAPVILAKLLPRYVDLSVTNSFTLTGGKSTYKPPPGGTNISIWGSAVEGLAKGLALELKPLRVNLVAPGPVKTRLLETFADDNMGGNVDALYDALKNDTLGGFVAEPSDVAEAYIYLMKDRFATGTVIHNNGGVFLI